MRENPRQKQEERKVIDLQHERTKRGMSPIRILSAEETKRNEEGAIASRKPYMQEEVVRKHFMGISMPAIVEARRRAEKVLAETLTRDRERAEENLWVALENVLPAEMISALGDPQEDDRVYLATIARAFLKLSDVIIG